MEYFYIIVVVIAVVLLILCLVAVGISLQAKGTTDPFPKLQAPCPDGWGQDVSGRCLLGAVNKGTPTVLTGTSLSASDEVAWSSVDSTKYTVNPTATICDKRKWAIANGITWDGVSNYNQCT